MVVVVYCWSFSLETTYSDLQYHLNVSLFPSPSLSICLCQTVIRLLHPKCEKRTLSTQATSLDVTTHIMNQQNTISVMSQSTH